MSNLMVESLPENNERSDSRNPPRFIEIRREYQFTKDELHHKSKAPSSHTTTKTTFDHSNPTYPPVSNSELPRGHAGWKSSRLCRRSSEYEDVYSKRLRERGTPDWYRRYSFRQDRSSRRLGINGDLKDKMERIERKKEVKNVENSRDTRNTVGVRDTTGMRYFEEARNKSGRKDARNSIHSPDKRVVENTRYPEDKRNTRDTEDRLRLSTEDAKANRGYPSTSGIRSTGETSIAGDKVVAEKSNIRATRNNSVTYPNVGSLSSYINHDIHSLTDLKLGTPSRSSPVAKVPPPIAPKPIRPKPQLTRPDSPAGSLRSNFSNTSSHGTHNSASSKKSVKSILKKPRVGRLVLLEEPSSFTLLAMVSCILCFPFGIYALVKSDQVNAAIDENDYETALRASKKIKSFCIGVTIAYLGVLCIGGALIAKYFITGELF